MTVVDPEGLRGGATLTSIAWLNCHNKNPQNYYRLVMRRNRAHRELGDEIGWANWLRLMGAVEWWPTGTEEPRERAVRLDRLRSRGHPIEMLSADDVLALEPDVSRSSLEGCVAVFYPTDEAGVTDLLERSGRIAGVRSRAGRELKADHVVNCAGRASNTIGLRLGYSVPLEWKPGMTVATDLYRNNVSRVINAPKIHIKPEGAGRLLLHAKSADRLVEAVLPRLQNVKIADVRTTVRPYPADGKPVFGTLPGVDGYHLAVMHSGVSLSPLIGRAAAEEILHGRASADFEAYPPMRFQAQLQQMTASGAHQDHI
ncbi:NAD(P)/FAD-dependent oxidoreductase [Ensifer aridi]|uniref:NAD(P)/FAD-dependent oxidoreductase n=1 Tax=Ensifer aridi TaxID=1708715 RepID=UPI0015567533|nr:FAD-binding oxidoreductase [Ensifer aridi]